MKLKNQVLALFDEIKPEQPTMENHLANQYDIEVKSAYWSGLALAVLVDGSVEDEELAYLEALAGSLSLPPEIIDFLDELKEDPGKANLAQLPKLVADEKLRKTFLLDCLYIMRLSNDEDSWEDQQLIEKYGSLLKVKPMEFNELKTLSTLLAAGSLRPIFDFSKSHEELNQDIYQHLLTLKGVSLDDYGKKEKMSISKNLKYAFIDINCLTNGNKITKEPVTIGQFAAYLGYMHERQLVTVDTDNQSLLFADDTSMDYPCMVEDGAVGEANFIEMLGGNADEKLSSVSFSQAVCFAEWCSEMLGQQVELPVLADGKNCHEHLQDLSNEYLFIKEGENGDDEDFVPAIVKANEDGVPLKIRRQPQAE